jgi:HD-GYP domain-containing protein (c-di-GMP phosphodiesterase class II)
VIELEAFKSLLSSLAPVSGIHYQLLGSNAEVVFSTDGARPKELSVKEFHDLSNLIIAQKAFQYSLYNGQYFLCGIPLEDGQDGFHALVAFGRPPHRSFSHKAGNDAKAYHAAEMKSFLSNLKTLIEESLSAKQEAEEVDQHLEHSFEDLYLYGQLAAQVQALTFSADMLKELIRKVLENMRVDAAFVLLPDRQQYNTQMVSPGSSHQCLAQENFFENLVNMIPPDAPTLVEKYFIINDSREIQKFRDMADAPFRFLAINVGNNDRSYGWLGLVSFNLEEIFRRGELQLLVSMAEQLAAFLANADLHKDLEAFVVNMVKSLVFAIEAKDEYTRGHSERVSRYSMLLGAQLGLIEVELTDLKWASILHDIGKIGIPESVLNNPDSLTDDERAIIRGHPRKGADILKPVDQLAGSIPSILHHHERYDGRGYPKGLKGDEIPLAARIIAVADTFDAISSDRAYRAGKSLEATIAIVEEVSGSQLDPRVVAAFKKVYKAGLTQEKEEESC